MDKTDGHFYIKYNDDRNLFEAIQFDPENNKLWAIAEESNSLEDLLKRCRESGLKHLEGVERSAINEVLQWLRDRPALECVEELWNGESSLTKKGPIGFSPPTLDGR